MIVTPDAREPVICPTCGADEMGCQVKTGLSGRRCCDACSHLTETNRTRNDKEN